MKSLYKTVRSMAKISSNSNANFAVILPSGSAGATLISASLAIKSSAVESMLASTQKSSCHNAKALASVQLEATTMVTDKRGSSDVRYAGITNKTTRDFDP